MTTPEPADTDNTDNTDTADLPDDVGAELDDDQADDDAQTAPFVEVDVQDDEATEHDLGEHDDDGTGDDQ